MALFSGSFCCCFATILTVVLTYTSYQPPPCLGRPPTRRCSLCGRAVPHLSLHRPSPSVAGYVRWASGHRHDHRYDQGVVAPCRPVWSRDGDPGLRGSFDVATAAQAAERNVNKRYQLIARVRSCCHRHPVIMSVHLQSSDVSTSGHFCASTTTLSRCVTTVESTCCVSRRRGTTPTAPSSVVCAAPATTSSTDRVHAPAPLTTTMAASSSCQPPTSVCRPLPSLNRPASNSSVLKLPLEVPPSSSSFFIDPAARRCSRSSSTAG